MKKTISLNEQYLFRRLYRTGKQSVQPHIAVYSRKTRRGANRPGVNRLGITTTKKLGNAVQRNRARRVIKEAYRLSEDKLPSGLDIVIVARQRAVHCKMQDVRRSLLRALVPETKPNQEAQKNPKAE